MKSRTGLNKGAWVKIATLTFLLLVFAPAALSHSLGWTLPQRLSSAQPVGDGEGGEREIRAGVAANREGVLVGWRDYSSFKRYTNERAQFVIRHAPQPGQGFGPALVLGEASLYPLANVELAATESSYVAGWTGEDGLHLARISPEGQLTAEQIITDNSLPFDLTSDGRNYYVVSGNARISASYDDGFTWTSPTAWGIGTEARVAASDGSVSVSYLSRKSVYDEYELYVSNASDEGRVLNVSDRQISSDQRIIYDQDIAASGNTHLVLWVSAAPTSSDVRISLSRSVDAGLTWSAPYTSEALTALPMLTIGVKSFDLVPTSEGFEFYVRDDVDSLRRYVSADGASWAEAASPPVVGETSWLDVAVYGDQRHVVGTEKREYSSFPVYQYGGADVPTATRLTIQGREERRVVVTGHLTPTEPGAAVRVVYLQKRLGKFYRVARKTLTAGGDGSFATSFRLTSAATCKLKASYAGDPTHLPSRATSLTEC